MKKLFGTFVFLVFITLNAQNNNDCACCSENYKAFDFWIGEWNVTTPDGKVAGSNIIIKEEDGCVIRENWSNANSGFTGTSLNFYNPNTEKWEQLWVDNSGSVLKLSGNRVDNQMILLSEDFTKSDGKTYRNRIIWTKNDDGTIRQLWEVLFQDEVVNTLFDGLYKKK